VGGIFFFFSEDIGWVNINSYMLDFNPIIFNILSITILPHLQMAQTFGCFFVRPDHTCLLKIVIGLYGALY